MPRVTPAVAKKRTRSPPDEMLPFFMLLARYRTMTVPHAHHLSLASLGEGRTERRTRSRISTLVDQGYLNEFMLAALPPTRFLYLNQAVWTKWPSILALTTENARKKPTLDTALYAWHRAALAIAAQADGYTVGRDLAALTALRRFLVDGAQKRAEEAKPAERDGLVRVVSQLRRLPLLQPWTRSTCEGCGADAPIGAEPKVCNECGSMFRRRIVEAPHKCARCGLHEEHGGAHIAEGIACPGCLRLVDYLPFDLAWRRDASSTFDVRVLLADNPYRSVQAQLDELPIRTFDQPRVPIVVRPSDDGTVFDMATKTYLQRGPRFRQLVRAFDPDASRPESFPFWMTATLIHAVYPEAHFRVLKDKTE